ncbi:MAG: hypothetical protein PHU95_00650 [Candidatus Thermoplasmatota archaeon]|nr:hypothetical protein [Candidatus Thermoplasmatota archaeon]MDD5777946.1 hypothetical protein [Candidatus Thermoplasmatota archaeon]
MRLIGYDIEDGREVVEFQREHLEESGKMECQYALWREGGRLMFGLIGRGAQGVPVDDRVRRHVESMIEKGYVDVCYKYSSVTEEFGEGFLTEVIPAPLCDRNLLPTPVVEQLQKMLKEYIIPELEKGG